MDENLGWIGRVHRHTDIALGYGLHPQELSAVEHMLLWRTYIFLIQE